MATRTPTLAGAERVATILLAVVYVIYGWAIASAMISLWPKLATNPAALAAMEAKATKAELDAKTLADSVAKLPNTTVDPKDSTAKDTAAVRRAAESRTRLLRLQGEATSARRLVDSVKSVAAVEAIKPTDVTLFFDRVSLTDLTLDTRLILLAMAIGALGSFVHMGHSFVTFVGNRTFRASWTLWYLLRPFIGAGLAVVLYFVVRGALFPTGLGTSVDVNPFGVASLAALAGMFSKQATDKLSEVFDTLFRTAPRNGDGQRADKPAPPLQVKAAQGKKTGNTVTFTVDGVGFVQASQVKAEGKSIPTMFVSATQLTATMPDTALPAGKPTVTVVVENPRTPAGTPTSNSVEATIT